MIVSLFCQSVHLDRHKCKLQRPLPSVEAYLQIQDVIFVCLFFKLSTLEKVNQIEY